MNAFMLDGWTPILLLGAIFLVGIYFISRKVSRKTLYTVSLVFSFICFGLVLYSIFVVGGWEGMGLGFVAISVLLGTWIGTIIGISSKKINV
ncbi:YesK family protein [Lysinibacillus sp. G4S2]|uniref:YesK family protein n=2 Tax=unclassified Lysinibacillus TaxID=2636778 RepID=UPI0025A0B8DA|nr:YesK family protein [Lysinibacillus sp. G4S2]MDM5249017.1 YesK family protein [Lysinibacillus sp. G4S2]